MKAGGTLYSGRPYSVRAPFFGFARDRENVLSVREILTQ